ncbi:MAG: carboxypeptidase regulatory-like domain-containing protein [Gemmatimonadaceae bacterium]|nr:carboxypeptidase regulatory-like domain-containing protein [Gemmatimonadaceae bacterium]
MRIDRGVASMVGLVMFCASSVCSTVEAQSIALRAPGPNSLSGVVTDSLGNFIAEADVYISSLKRRVRTNGDGSFLFEKLKPGTYDVGARRLGYVARSYRVVVGDDGGTVNIRMIRIGFSLPSMVTTAERTGLSGVVGDSAYGAMSDVVVRVIGNEAHTFTDSAGAFFLPLKPGRYMVELKRDGFSTQRVGVSIPEHEGRKIAAWMIPRQGRPNPLEGANVFEMSQRLMRASPVWSKYYTREDMAKQGISEIRQVVNMAAMKLVDPDCPVLIDGGPKTLPVWQLSAGDVEFVELYTARPARRTVTSLNGNPQKFSTSTSMTPTSPRDQSACGVSVVAWLRH